MNQTFCWYDKASSETVKTKNIFLSAYSWYINETLFSLAVMHFSVVTATRVNKPGFRTPFLSTSNVSAYHDETELFGMNIALKHSKKFN